MRNRSVVVLLGITFIMAACRSTSTAGAGRTERERDSVIGQSALPGARGVQRALGASDSARTRSAALDSMASQ
jgi:hypothetical protein